MSRTRFVASLLLSAALHAVLGLLLWFDVVGTGGGFGIGSGPGFGIGQGGGMGLGKGHKRQIFALKDVRAEPARPRRGRIEDRLAAVSDLAPAAPSTISLVGDLPVAAAKPVALPPPSAAPRSDVAAKGTSGAVVVGGLGGAGGGGGFGVSLGGAFGRYVSGLREKGLDIVFIVDGTASMGDVIALVRRDLASLVDTIGGMVPVARIGFVVYRDRKDDVPIEIAPLTASRTKLAAFLAGVRAEGGGDWPESLNLGLEAALEKMKWRPNAKRILVFVASSPPHDDERAATIAIARQVHDEGGAVSAIDLSRSMHEEFAQKWARSTFGRDATREELETMPAFYDEVRGEFSAIVGAGGGELVQFHQNDRLVEHMLVLAFGTRWKKEVEQLARLPRPAD
ncbi:MAG TPA: vWA domain-containing protein [Candidatus Binatia bacterium]|nr:vWA domain-containing protein [Candidatus Binatia bacterium]